MNQSTQVNSLYGIAEFTLFITSYIPLFVLIIFKQASENMEYLNFGGFNQLAFKTFFTKFGFSFFLLLISIFSIIGCKLLFYNFNKNVKNGENIILEDVKNRNSESIGYIATYIIPFIFQSFNDWYEIFAFIFLMIIIYRIYINSNLLLINPLLSFKYSLFEIEYKEQNGKRRNGLIIIKEKHLIEDSIIKIYPIGCKLFFAINKNSNN